MQTDRVRGRHSALQVPVAHVGCYCRSCSSPIIGAPCTLRRVTRRVTLRSGGHLHPLPGLGGAPRGLQTLLLLGRRMGRR